MNRIFMFDGEDGVHCECGNEEVLGNKDDYENFVVNWDQKSGKPGMIASCRKCYCNMDRVETIPRAAMKINNK